MKLNDKIAIKKDWFNDPIFWSIKDNSKITIERVIILSLTNSPKFITVATLYFLFGEELLNNFYKKYENKLNNKLKYIFSKGLKLAKEVEIEKGNNRSIRHNK